MCLYSLTFGKVHIGCRELLTYTPKCPQTANSIAETEFFITSFYEETLFDENIVNWKRKMTELQPVMDTIEV